MFENHHMQLNYKLQHAVSCFLGSFFKLVPMELIITLALAIALLDDSTAALNLSRSQCWYPVLLQIPSSFINMRNICNRSHKEIVYIRSLSLVLGLPYSMQEMLWRSHQIRIYIKKHIQTFYVESRSSTSV